MGIFTDAIREVKNSIIKLAMFEEALNAILLFLATYIVSSIFSLGLVAPLIIGLAYFCFALYRESKVKPTKIVESRYKDLQEKLSTASEYASVDNRVVNELKSDVLKNLRKVEEASFLSERRIYAKSIISIVLCFVILLVSPVSTGFFKAVHVPDVFHRGAATEEAGHFKVIDENKRGDKPIKVDNPNEQIYGIPTTAKIGTEELKVVFRPAGSELSTSNVKPPEELQFNEQYPEEIVPVASESMDEQIPKEQQELVKRYFKNVVQSGSD